MPKKLTQEQWEEKSKLIHKNNYDYSKVDYKNSKSKVLIYCKKHDSWFTQGAYAHMTGATSCKKCISEIRHNINVLTKEEFLKKINSNDITCIGEYKSSAERIKVQCNKCNGVWTPFASNILKGEGCPYCNGNHKYTTEEWIQKSKSLFGDAFDYSKVNYINAKTDVVLKCNKCGLEFLCNPHNHLSKYNKCGCPHCSKSSGEKLIYGFLKNNNILFEEQKIFEGLKYKHDLKFDFFLVDFNTCIEFDGEQHRNPKHYFNKFNDFTEQQIKDELKNEYCKKNGISLIRIENIKDIKSILMKFVI